MIKIWELQNDLAAGWPSVPSAHMSGLHAARHAQIRPAAGNLASKRELGIYRVSRSTLVAEFTNVSVCEPVSPELSAKLPISTGEI